jgi:hypothetical protein
LRAKTDQITVDEARLLPRFRAVFDRVHMNHSQAEALTAEVTRANSQGIPVRPPKTPAGGDPMSLRGIPAIGRGVGGAITGTRPGDRL